MGSVGVGGGEVHSYNAVMRDFIMHQYFLGSLSKSGYLVWEFRGYRFFLLQQNDSYRSIRVKTEWDYYTSLGMSGRMAWV